jgi:hypothetical protein
MAYLQSTIITGSQNVLNVAGSGSVSNTSLSSVNGNNGRLFEVTDDLSNSLFSVNTIAGLPVIEAFADNTVKLGKYNAGSGVLNISGSTVEVSGSLNLLGGKKYTYTTDSSYSFDFVTVIAPGQLIANTIYLISYYWTGAASPYSVSGASIIAPVSTNGTGTDDYAYPLPSSNTGGTGLTVSFRTIAGTAPNTSGLQILLYNPGGGFGTGTLTIKAAPLSTVL